MYNIMYMHSVCICHHLGKKTLGVRRKNLQKQATTARRSGWLPSNPKVKGQSSSSLAGNRRTSSDDLSEAAHDGGGSVSVTRQEGAETNSMGSSNEALVLEEASREEGGGSLTGADSSVEQRLQGATISSAESGEQRREQAPSSPCAAEKSREFVKMAKKEKLSLSLKSRKRKSYQRLPSQSPSSGPLSGIEFNTHPLAAKWKKNALLNPPYLNIMKLKLSPAQVRRRKREGESAKRRTESDSSETSSSSRGKGKEKKREKFTKQVVVYTVNTRQRAKQRRNSGVPESEAEELEMALQESLDTLHASSSSTQGECSTSLEEPSETLLCIEDSVSSSSGSVGVGDFESARKHLRNNSDSSKFSSSDGRVSAKGGSLLEEMPTVRGEELVISPEKMEMEDGCASEASSQGIESDFNLVMTESESDSDERAVGVSRKRRRTEEEVEEVVGPCTAQHARVTLGERHSPSLLPHPSRVLMASSSLQPHLPSLPLPHPRPTVPALPQLLHYQGPPSSSSSRQLPLSPQHMCTEASVTTKASSSTQVKPPSLSRYITNQTPPRMEIVPAPSLSVLRPLREPPSVARLCETAASYGLPAAMHTRAFYSNPADVQPPRSAECCRVFLFACLFVCLCFKNSSISMTCLQLVFFGPCREVNRKLVRVSSRMVSL